MVNRATRLVLVFCVTLGSLFHNGCKACDYTNKKVLSVELGDSFDTVEFKVPDIYSDELTASPAGLASWTHPLFEGVFVFSFVDGEAIPTMADLDEGFSLQDSKLILSAVFLYYGKGDSRNEILLADSPSDWGGYWDVLDFVYGK